MTPLPQQTGLSHCSVAASAAEAGYRIDGFEFIPRSTLVIALDDGAEQLLQDCSRLPWAGAHFLAFEGAQRGSGDGLTGDSALRALDGEAVWLSEELVGADVTVMVATTDAAAPRAAAIGQACAVNGIMTAGVVVQSGRDASRVTSSLRPYAMVLLVSAEIDDVPAVLVALRA